MQNPLAALMMPTLVAEAASSPATVEPGNGSFADTFVEAGTKSEGELRTDEPAQLDPGMPLFWPAMLAPRSAFLVAADASVDADMQPFALPVLRGEGTAPLIVVEGDSSGSAMDLHVDQDATESGAAVSSIDAELFAARSEPALRLDAVVGPVLPAGSAELPAAKSKIDAIPLLRAATPEDPAALPPAVKPEAELVTESDKQDADGPKQTAIDRPDKEDTATVAQPNGPPVDDGDAALPISRHTLDAVVSGPLNPPVPVPGQLTVQPLSNSYGIQVLARDPVGDVSPTWQVGLPDAEIVEWTNSQPSVGSSTLSVGLELQTEEPSALSPNPTSSPSNDMGFAAPEGGSFWERFFSDPSISAADHLQRSASGVSPSDGVIPLATAAIPGLAQTAVAFTTSLTRSDLQPLAETPSKGPEEVLKPHRIRPESVDVPAEAGDDFIGIAQAEMVIGGWDEDLARFDDGSDLLHSHGLASSARVSAGFSISHASLPTLPVPQIAAQLTGVLVRNPGTVTELALSPEELGHVRLRMEPDSANPDRMLIMISVERPETLELFRRHAGELAEAIRSAGYSGADIGFGQNGREDSPDQRREPSSSGGHLQFDETSHIEPARMLSAGVSLDLRL